MEKILVMGLGKSGVGAAKLLAGRAQVSAWDSKPEEKLNQENIAALKELGVNLITGTEEVQGQFDRVIISPGIPVNHPVARACVEGGAELMGELELACENCAGEFVAITGTNGKTTVTTLVGEMYKAASVPSCVVGNIGLAVSEVCAGAEEGTVMITECSSFQLETIKTFRPHISAILNLTPDHLDRHGSFEYYIDAKCRVFENQTSDDFLVYNAADSILAGRLRNVSNVRKVPFSIYAAPADFEDEPYAAYIEDGRMVVKVSGKIKKLCLADELQIPGKHNLENALAAAAIAVLGGIRSATVASVLKHFKGVEHRIEYVRTLRGVRYINDSKGTNPDSTIKAVEAFNTPIVLIAGGYEKNSDFKPLINRFDGKVKYLVLLGKTAPRFADAARECGFDPDRIIRCNSLEACVASAAQLSCEGDTVLLSPACASWDMFKSYEERGEEFKRIVRSLQ